MKVVYDIIIAIKNKFLCIINRAYLNFLLHDLDFDRWHINGTYFCRKYKMLAVKEINQLEPSLFIDFGCGLGEIVSRVKLPKNRKFGLDIDSRLEKAIKRVNPSKFSFFTSKENLVNSAKLEIEKRNGPIVITFLNLSHNLTQKELLGNINFFLKELGPYILFIDTKKPNQRRRTHEFLEKQKGLIKSFRQIDQIRNLYIIDLSISTIKI